MCLFAYRLSTEEMKGNQLRLYLSALAYTLVEGVRPGNTVVDGSWQPEIGYIAILPE
jgi:hypothetical protein